MGLLTWIKAALFALALSSLQFSLLPLVTEAAPIPAPQGASSALLSSSLLSMPSQPVYTVDPYVTSTQGTPLNGYQTNTVDEGLYGSAAPSNNAAGPVTTVSSSSGGSLPVAVPETPEGGTPMLPHTQLPWTYTTPMGAPPMYQPMYRPMYPAMRAPVSPMAWQATNMPDVYFRVGKNPYEKIQDPGPDGPDGDSWIMDTGRKVWGSCTDSAVPMNLNSVGMECVFTMNRDGSLVFDKNRIATLSKADGKVTCWTDRPKWSKSSVIRSCFEAGGHFYDALEHHFITPQEWMMDLWTGSNPVMLGKIIKAKSDDEKGEKKTSKKEDGDGDKEDRMDDHNDD